MKVEEVLHMVGGSGENSYANNSRLQEKAIFRTTPMVKEAVSEICNTIQLDNFVAADLGCSSGPNTFLVISNIIEAIEQYYCEFKQNQPTIQYFLNDLSSNDFNNIFKLFMHYEKQLRDKKREEYVPIYVSGLPGSFYKRLFPSKSVHFFHSSYCLHWLSQVPRGLSDQKCAELNKGNIYIVDASSSVVYRLYFNQFKSDFSDFLTSRSKELISGGKMVLSFLGRRNDPTIGDTFHLWRLLVDALNSMSFEGLVEEPKLDAFNLPYYTPLMEEVESIIEEEGSFHLDQAQTFDSNWDPFDNSTDNFVVDRALSGENVAKYMRTVVEPLLSCHFGEDIIEDLFSRYAKNIAKHMSVGKPKFVLLLLALKLKQ